MSAFGLVADIELQAILRNYASEVVKRNAQDCIFRQGQEPNGFYLINHGSVRLSMESAKGQRVMERVVGEGCLVGLPATANGRPYSLTCEVVEDVELTYLSRKDFANLMKCESGAALKLLGLLSSEVQAVRREVAQSPKVRTAAISVLSS
jgi:CRP-like cAMP-binding protein